MPFRCTGAQPVHLRHGTLSSDNARGPYPTPTAHVLSTCARSSQGVTVNRVFARCRLNCPRASITCEPTVASSGICVLAESPPLGSDRKTPSVVLPCREAVKL